MNANTYRAKIKCVRFLYHYRLQYLYHRTQGTVRHVAENSYTQTSKCSQQKFTNQLYKQCVCIYTKAPTSNMAKYRPQHGKSAPEFLNYSARVHLACHRIPDPPLVKPLTPASGVLCMTQVTQHRINYRKNDQKASLGGQSSDFWPWYKGAPIIWCVQGLLQRVNFTWT